jgi:hypothetical protein
MGGAIIKAAFCVGVVGLLYQPNAQSASITGTVRNQNKQPLAGVTGSLLALGKSATTGAGGTFSFGDAFIVWGRAGKGALNDRPALDAGLLRFRVKDRTGRVRIRLFDLTGKPAATIVDGALRRGDYGINPLVPGLAAQVYVLRIGIGNAAYAMKLPSLGNTVHTASTPVRDIFEAKEALARIAAASDTLKLVKTGYSLERKAIGSYSGAHDFIMTDTAWFWGDRSKIPTATNVMTYVFLNRTYGKFTDAQMFWKFGSMAVRSFAEAPYYDMEANSSGRVYCYAGASNSKYNDFMEHTISATAWNGNTTRVDAFVLPCAIRLHCKDGYDEILGEEYHVFAMGRDSLWQAYREAVPVEFDSCARWDADGTPLRIVAPGKGEGVFNTGQKYADYFSAYLKQIGQGDATTNQVFSCSGNPYGSNAALAGATNRHVAHLPQSQWSDKSLFYREAPANFYAKFWHDHGFQGKAYGFAYDDAANQAAYASHGGPQYLIIAIGW